MTDTLWKIVFDKPVDYLIPMFYVEFGELESAMMDAVNRVTAEEATGFSVYPTRFKDKGYRPR